MNNFYVIDNFNRGLTQIMNIKLFHISTFCMFAPIVHI